MALPKTIPHLASFMQAYAKGEDYFTKACSLIRDHGFMQTWAVEECTEFVKEIQSRSARRAQDPERADYEARQHRYGASPSPPVVHRPHVDNRPAWMTNSSQRQPQASR
jgi:hypothetical protein